MVLSEGKGAALSWSHVQGGARFEYRLDGTLVSVAQWPARHEPADRAAVALLNRLLDAGDAIDQEAAVLVPQAGLAGLDDDQAATLGLPAPVPFILDVHSRGSLRDPEFGFRIRWVRPDRVVVHGTSRDGAFLHADRAVFRLAEPFFSILAALESFSADPPATIDERLLAWGEVSRLAGLEIDQVRPDRYLDSLKVYRASRFSIRLSAGTDKEIQFAPVLLAEPLRGPIAPVEELSDDRHQQGSPLLAPNDQTAFEGRFCSFTDAKRSYALQGGCYVVLDEACRRGLAVVRRYQQASPAERRAFSANPRAFLREHLESDLTEETLEALFEEFETYSGRVEGVGLHVPKVLPWIEKKGDSWLPADRLGLLIDGVRLEVAADRLPSLVNELTAADAAGQAFVTFDGERIPVSASTLAAVQELSTALRAMEAEPEVSAPSRSELPAAERQILLIQDNLEENIYRVEPRPGRPGELSDPTLRSELKDYQREGLRWLQRHWRAGSPGALLADDMGLGKTIQALAFLAWLREEMEAGTVKRTPVLIVAPTGLLKNWEDEHRIHLEQPGLGTLLRAYGEGLRGLKISRSGNVLVAV